MTINTIPDLAVQCLYALGRSQDQPAIQFEGHWHSWSDLQDVAAALWQHLDDLALPEQAKIAFVSLNSPAAISALFALIAKRKNIAMVYGFQSAAAIMSQLQGINPALVILAGLGGTADQISLPIPILCVEGRSALTLRNAEPVQSPALGPDERVIEILTSGTTGQPKPFPLPYETIARNYVGQVQPWTKETAAKPPALLYFPLANISGIYSTLPPLLAGQRAVLLDRFSIDAWHEYVIKYRPSQSGIPPAAMREFLERDIPVEDLASIKTMGSGAAPLDPFLHRSFEDRYNIPILTSYGATEFAGPVCIMTPALYAQWGKAKLGSVGQPIMGAYIRIIDPESGKELPAMETGLLEVVSPRIGKDWIKTSDLGYLDEDGFLFLAGRADGAIIRGGFKILPDGIERTLLQHPAIAETVVTAVADDRLGQVPAAAICFRKDANAPTFAELESHLRESLPATHIPVHWHICDALPRTASFKIDRAAVRALFM